MRKLPAGDYNIICKGKSGQLIQLSPNPERKDGHSQHPIRGILHIIANCAYGVVSDGSYIYFSTNVFWSQLNSISLWEQRLYKYSIVDAERIWTTKLIYVYHGVNDRFSTSSGGHLFVMGDYLYLFKGGGGTNYKYQRYLKSDGSKYGEEIQSDWIEWNPPDGYFRGLYGPFRWGSNCFVDGNYIYAYWAYHRHYHSGGYDAPTNIYLVKLDSDLHQVSATICNISYPGYEIEYNFHRLFVVGWDGSHICGGYNACYRLPNPPPYDSFCEVAWAKWSKSGGAPTSKWILPPPANPEDVALASGCGGNTIIIGDEIWALGEYHDCDDPPWGPINPEKNAMYYNSNWRHTGIPGYSSSADFGFYNGSFYRGCYGETPSCSYHIRQIAKHGDKVYIVSREVGTHEMTPSGVYRHVRIV